MTVPAPTVPSDNAGKIPLRLCAFNVAGGRRSAGGQAGGADNGLGHLLFSVVAVVWEIGSDLPAASARKAQINLPTVCYLPSKRAASAAAEEAERKARKRLSRGRRRACDRNAGRAKNTDASTALAVFSGDRSDTNRINQSSTSEQARKRERNRRRRRHSHRYLLVTVKMSCSSSPAMDSDNKTTFNEFLAIGS
ncbi:Ion-translocating oxidoreductase complex subunit [Trichinella pseudospiralis]